ncbi:MAG: hypothetical protein LBH55_04120 [Mycoplasmataceae bacterium]|jgi:hypothetical protein|nr:hypothetical protein [Mycoplasmataceae bacterium]
MFKLKKVFVLLNINLDNIEVFCFDNTSDETTCLYHSKTNYNTIIEFEMVIKNLIIQIDNFLALVVEKYVIKFSQDIEQENIVRYDYIFENLGVKYFPYITDQKVFANLCNEEKGNVYISILANATYLYCGNDVYALSIGHKVIYEKIALATKINPKNIMNILDFYKNDHKKNLTIKITYNDYLNYTKLSVNNFIEIKNKVINNFFEKLKTFIISKGLFKYKCVVIKNSNNKYMLNEINDIDFSFDFLNNEKIIGLENEDQIFYPCIKYIKDTFVDEYSIGAYTNSAISESLKKKQILLTLGIISTNLSAKLGDEKK